MKRSKKARLLQVAKKKPIVASGDVASHGISRMQLSRMSRDGDLTHVGRGLYVLADAQPSANRTVAEVCKRVPSGVVCLLSALGFHGLTTQAPFQVWIAIDRKAWTPKEPKLPIRILRFSGRALTCGIERHKVEGVSVKVYSPAKTVADCFKYRNKIGLDVALEALQDYRRVRKYTMDELWKYAKICRVATVMKPYLESISSQ